ncbi:HNH endonuclease signature motif containing protein [Alteromonas gracilis]
MTTTTSTPLRPRAEVLDDAVAAIERQRRAQVDLLADAAAYVLSAPEPVDADGGALFGERLLQVAGEGAPEVCEFAIIELAARLGWSVDAASTLAAQAVELIHRLPHVWALTVEGVIPPRLAQQIADRTIIVTASVAARADRWLVADPRGLGIKQVEATLDTLQLHEDPDRIVGLEESLLADRHVTMMPDKRTPSAVRVEMLLEPDDARAFDHAVSDVAATLKALGDEDDLQIRRAKAVGVLASPQAALDLLDRGLAPTRRAPGTDLHLHLGLADLAKAADGTPGPVDVEGLGVVSTDLIRRWLDASDLRVNVRPVLHLPGSHELTDGPQFGTWPAERSDVLTGCSATLTQAAVAAALASSSAALGWTPADCHDPPPAMREVVILRDAECAFPHCHRSSRHADIDHIEPWGNPDEGGPPGQTHPDNLAPLCRRHHRFKTHTDWTYRRAPDGSFTWTSPTGLEITTATRRRRPTRP